MSARWECASCGGQYADTGPDGTAYYHACPPVTDPATMTTRERAERRDERPRDRRHPLSVPGGAGAGAPERRRPPDRKARPLPIMAEGRGRTRLP